MRVSTAQIFQNGINNILSQQTNVNRTQAEVSTGQRVLTPSDDPVAAAQIVRINSELTQIDQYQDNADLAQTQLELQENVLDTSEEVLQRVRELVIQANNATQTSETREFIAAEIEERLGELIDVANTQDFNGDYIFAGYQTNTEPFGFDAGTLVYSGDDGQRFAQISSSSRVAVSDPGSALFLRIPQGNGSFTFSANPANTGNASIGQTSASIDYVRDDYLIEFSQATPADPISYTVTDSAANVIETGTYENGDSLSFAGAVVEFQGTPQDGDTFAVNASTPQDVFSSLSTIVDSLTNADDNATANAVLSTDLSLALENIDRALENFSEARSNVGVRLNRLDSQREINTSFAIQLEATLSNIEDVDLSEAIGELNQQLTSLQVAQQAFVSVQGLSLFNFL